MGKRVYELAKELGVDSKQVIQRLKDAGISVDGHLAPLSREDEEKAKKLFEAPRPGDVQVTKMAGGRVVRRRAAETTPAPEAKAPEPPPPPPSPAEIAEEEGTEKSEEQVATDDVRTPEVVAAETAAGTPEPAPVAADEKPKTAEAVPREVVPPAAPDKPKTEDPRAKEPPPKGAPPPIKALADEADKKSKAKRLVYDRRRDVITVRAFLGRDEEEAEHVEARPQVRRNKRPVQRRGRPQKTVLTVPRAEKRVIRCEGEVIQVGELAHHMGVKANEVIRKLMGMGVMASMTQALDMDTACIIASEYGFTVEKVGFDPAEYLKEAPDGELELMPRAPVVTVMGHVDHGKTTLLDRIRNAAVAEGEAGGITQHIGAYRVKTKGGDIVFLDTPGHEAFTAMRARGAGATDIVILVVAADDGVMAQTREAIAHAKAANVPIIVAVNKIDKPDSNLDRVRRELGDEGIIPEDWGGPNIFCEVSAKQGLGIENLLEAVLLQSEVLELTANAEKPGRGVVLESQLDRQIGPVATVLIQAGTLKIGDAVMAGLAHGRVRVMSDDQGRSVQTAGPSTPVRIAGLNMVPNAGDVFTVMPDERKAREVVDFHIEQIKRARTASAASRVSLEDFFSMVQTGATVKELRVIIRADVQGSLGPLIDSITKLKHPEISLKVVHNAVGNIAESDINLAIASNAVVVGFNVAVDPKAQHLADNEKVDVKRYSVIYDVIDDLRKAMEGLLTPKLVEKLVGKAEVRQVFAVSKVGKIAGCYVTMGHVQRTLEVRLVRKGETLFTGKLSSLKRFKDDVRDVKQGFECGLGIDGYEELLEGDILEFYEYESVREVLSPIT